MGQIESLVFLVGAAVLLAQLARLTNVPYPVFLVLGGLAIGFTPGLPTVEVSPAVIFVAFLPPLLNSEAFSFSPLDLRARLRPIILLAVGLVLLTAAAIALVAHYVVGLPWAASFVLGAILAPTDPVAAQAVFRRLGVPEHVGTVVGGESLVNDGSALVIFNVAVAAVVAGSFSVWSAGLDFVVSGGGGLLFGLVFAVTILPVWARIRDPQVLVAASLLIPYAVYVLAEQVLGISGILAVVAYGLYQGWRSPRLFPLASARMQALSFWGVLVFLLESLLFVLVGQQLPTILADLGDYDPMEILFYAVLVYGVLVGARFAWFFSVPYLHPVFDRLFRTRYLRAPWQERLVMGWSGMRGAVSLAAALAVPLTVGTGDPFPGRDLIVLLSYAAILATLVVQGLTLGPLVRVLRLGGGTGEGEGLSELKARLAGAHAALEKLESTSEQAGVPPEAQENVREEYQKRIRNYSQGLEAGGATEEYRRGSAAWKSWRRDLISAEREAVLALRDRGEISPETMRHIERDLDLEESRIGG
ncbi:MAG: Na+/H+ antiporter [Rubrobacteraceae bacterium]